MCVCVCETQIPSPLSLLSSPLPLSFFLPSSLPPSLPYRNKDDRRQQKEDEKREKEREKERKKQEKERERLEKEKEKERKRKEEAYLKNRQKGLKTYKVSAPSLPLCLLHFNRMPTFNNSSYIA